MHNKQKYNRGNDIEMKYDNITQQNSYDYDTDLLEGECHINNAAVACRNRARMGFRYKMEGKEETQHRNIANR